ncbi:MAG TPA: uracil phosphoribosyltransferase [Verrucomicrobiales bacterium]|nr:uracil phosphoribosyltransferase [Verrucomicrobiales bacterium]
MREVHVIDHPVLQDKLADLRDRHTPVGEFRRLLADAGTLLFHEASRTLTTRQVSVQTPLKRARAKRMAKPILLVPVLRAGLGLLQGILPIIPTAQVGFIGLQRNELTLEAEAYYGKLPRRLARYAVFLLDPMLATGGSSGAALRQLQSRGARDLRLVCLVAAPEGIRHLRKSHPGMPVFCAAVDDRLDEQGYIVPGLGDAGDRQFGA